jgi:hypothetical protein
MGSHVVDTYCEANLFALIGLLVVVKYVKHLGGWHGTIKNDGD